MKRRFDERASRALHNHQELVMAVHNKRNQSALESLLAEQLVMSMAVAWEAFITDLLVTYVSMNPDPSIVALKTKILRSTSERFGPDAAKAVRFSFPKSITKARAAGLTDPKGWNISVNSAESLSKRANELLAAQHAKKFSLNADDSQLFDLTICIRNYLGHRSTSSRKTLKSAIAAITGDANSFLVGRFNDAGTYLKKKDSSGDTRAVFLVRQLIQIAHKL